MHADSQTTRAMRSLKVLVDLRRRRMLLPVYRKPFEVTEGQHQQHPPHHSVYTHRPHNFGPHQHRRPESPSYPHQRPQQQPPQQHQQRGMVTTSQAKSLLGFHPASTPTVTELREAYYKAAMECHPDVAAQPPQQAHDDEVNNNQNKKNNKKKTAVTMDFRELTEAYDYLLQHGHVNTDAPELYETMSKDDERDYRAACVHVLGLRAELVEESKQNPMFLRWLSGNTDGAQIWRNFLDTQGGLAQRIQPPTAYLTAKKPEDTTTPKNPSESMKSRRKRVRRR